MKKIAKNWKDDLKKKLDKPEKYILDIIEYLQYLSDDINFAYNLNYDDTDRIKDIIKIKYCHEIRQRADRELLRLDEKQPDSLMIWSVNDNDYYFIDDLPDDKLEKIILDITSLYKTDFILKEFKRMESILDIE